MTTKDLNATIQKLVKALEAAEITLKRIGAKNEQVAEMSLTALKDAGIDHKWPGGLFEDIAEAAQGRANLCRKAIAESSSNHYDILDRKG